MKSVKTRTVAYTGLMLAITILVQSLRYVFPVLASMQMGSFNALQLVVGTLVNLCLLITVWNVGIMPGLLISVTAPVMAFMQGQVPIPHMIAVIALGNAVFCVVAWIPFATAVTRFVLTMLAAFVKFGLLSLLVLKLVIPVLLPAAVDAAPKVETISKALSAGFVWPQLLTAVIGGLLAYWLSPRLPRAFE